MKSNRYRGFAFLLLLVLTPPLFAAREVKVEAVDVNWTTGPYRYDGAGNLMQVGPNHLQQTDTYRYDQVGRLSFATAHTRLYANEQTFRYDAFGNLVRIETNSERDGAAPLTSNTIVAVDPKTNRTYADPCAGINDGSCVFGNYDDAGNQTWSSAGVLYEFDALGMMVHLQSGAGDQQYVYDANNERIATITPIDGRYTLRDAGGKVVRELKYDGRGWTWQKDYVYRDGALLAAILPEGRHHFHLDHLGTPRVVTDDRGLTVAAHTYWPFGAEAPGSEVHPSERMKFTGHERDFGAGPAQDLDYMHARYYNPNAGRFLSVDPTWESADLVKPQSWNRYSYVYNSPIGNADLDGRCATSRCVFAPTKRGDVERLKIAAQNLVYGLVNSIEITAGGKGTTTTNRVTVTGGVSSTASVDRDLAVHSKNEGTAQVQVAGHTVVNATGTANYTTAPNQPTRVQSGHGASGPTSVETSGEIGKKDDGKVQLIGSKGSLSWDASVSLNRQSLQDAKRAASDLAQEAWNIFVDAYTERGSGN